MLKEQCKKPMRSINALSLTPNVNDWLSKSRYPRILHVFDGVCNLINECREVLSIVTPQIGNGPFNIVVEDDVLFSNHLNLQSPISAFPAQLNLGDFTIHTEDAKLWSPRPKWEMLHIRRDDIISQLTKLLITNYQSPVSNPQFSNSLVYALANADLSASLIAAQKLAGLGIGLTPAGDDFIMGAILAAWIIHPAKVVGAFTAEVTEVAAALTTSLSAAWLRSAGRGEAGIFWHQLFETLLTGDPFSIQLQINILLSIGHTSGEDALAGFLGVLTSWANVSCGELRPAVIP